MKKNKVILRKNLPAKLPVLSSIVAAIAIDYWNAPEWVIGSVGLLFLIIWIASIASLFTETGVNIFTEVSENMKGFKEKLRDRMENNKR